MPIRLDTRSADFGGRFAAFLDTKRETSADVEAVVRAIVADVAARGDAALVELTKQVRSRRPRRGVAARRNAPRSTPPWHNATAKPLDALRLAHARIAAYHRRQLPQDQRFTDGIGVELGYRWTPIAAVGLYVPGGTAAYPSSVLMNAVPAKVAGVARLVMVVPAPEGQLNPLVLAAARLAGVDEIFRVGGAQAIAALAYGTASIRPVDKIVGPGNAYVAAAKRLVFGKVGIDMIAGPSEVLILADGGANPDWIAADLLAQAEHDAAAQSILITDDAALADEVEQAVAAQLEDLAARGDRARVLAGLRRDRAGARSCRGDPADRCGCARASGDHGGRRRAAGRQGPQHRCDLHRRSYAGSDRRLCGGLQPRAADRALGALLLGPRRARLHEAHLDPQMRRRTARATRPCRDRARRSRGSRRARPLGRGAAQSAMSAPDQHRLVKVTLDEGSIGRSNPDVEHERAVAIYDLLEDNSFHPRGHEGGPYELALSITSNRLVFDIRLADGAPVVAHHLSLSPLRRIVKDYFLICDSYYAAIRTASPDQIEAIDMGRRGLHNEGSELLIERLRHKVEMDVDTARRLFTLICVLHWKG